MSTFLLASAVVLLLLVCVVESFQLQTTTHQSSLLAARHQLLMTHHNTDEEDESMHRDTRESVKRRSFLGALSFLFATTHPQSALAGIDVTGLQVEGGKGGNSAIASQLKAYDGSGSSRVQ